MSDYKTHHISQLNISKVDDVGLESFDPYESSLVFDNPSVVRAHLVQHFMDGDHDTFFFFFSLYMDYVGKGEISLATGIPERTIYNFINGQHKTSSFNVFKVMKYISDQVKQSA